MIPTKEQIAGALALVEEDIKRKAQYGARYDECRIILAAAYRASMAECEMWKRQYGELQKAVNNWNSDSSNLTKIVQMQERHEKEREEGV